MSNNYETKYDAWAASSPYASELIWLGDGGGQIQLMIADEDITIKESNGGFVLQSSSKALSNWVAKVNEAFSNTPIGFEEFLTAIMKLFSEQKGKRARTEEKQEMEDEDEDMEEYEEDDEHSKDKDDAEEEEEMEEGHAAEDFDLESDDFVQSIEILRKRKRWAQKSEELRKNVEKDAKKIEVDQIFSTNSAVGVLTNDLLNIMQNSEKLGFSATPIQDNIYKWNVKIFSFNPDSTISKHLKEVKSNFNYDYVELELTFVIDLYPFYPPTVKVIRPRLSGFLMGRITSLEILKLSYWDPVKDMRYVLGQIRTVLEEWGKIDVNNPLNANAEGAYSQLEYQLLRLAVVSETDPRVNKKYNLDAELINRQPVKKTKQVTEKDEKKSYWAKGTGYGFGNTQKVDWDIQAYLAAQKQKDLEIQTLLEDIGKELVNSEVSFDVLEESCLVPVLETFLWNDSLLDIEKHNKLYTAILMVVQIISNNDMLLPLLDNLPNQRNSILELLQPLYKQSQVYLKRVQSSVAQQDSFDFGLLIDIYLKLKEKISKLNASMKQLEGEINNATLSSTSSIANETPQERDIREEKTYIQAMKDLQFDLIKMDLRAHHYYDISRHATSSREKIIRLGQEQGSLATSLPLSFSSSVFVRVDEENMDFMQAIITGPADTPYRGGCFHFDIYFPSGYPNVPPLVNLQTTGGGKVRFNPNLYDSGKVCLSLLGTWSGSVGESWNKHTSTLLQVLVSIQSLILVPMPFFNEPGFEAQIGTRQGEENNRQYNEVIRTATIEHAIIGQLKNPTPGFEEVIRKHFLLQRDAIIRECEKWLAEGISSKAHYAKLLKLVSTMKTEFAKLRNHP